MVGSKFSTMTGVSISTGAEESKMIRPEGLMIQMVEERYVSSASSWDFTVSREA